MGFNSGFKGLTSLATIFVTFTQTTLTSLATIQHASGQAKRRSVGLSVAKVKEKQFLYMPTKALRIRGGSGLQIS